MLDLFAGTGSATAAFRDAGWEVVRVELDPQHEAEFHADVRERSWHGRRPDLVWASPPCTEFARESMPWTRTGTTPSLELVDAVDRIVQECNPRFFVLENSKGATRYLRPRYGAPLCLGPVRLFGDFPRFYCPVPAGWKQRFSGRHVVQRAQMPYQIGEALRKAIESSLFFRLEDKP